MDVVSLNSQLLDAVMYHKVHDVQRLLQQGADPNYDSYAGKSAAEKEGQPYTPLRMVMFCISDSLLDDDGLRDFAEVARLLTQFGAETKPAMEIAEQRYGAYNPDAQESPFMNVWRIVAEAKS